MFSRTKRKSNLKNIGHYRYDKQFVEILGGLENDV